MAGGWFEKLKQGLAKTRENTIDRIVSVVRSSGKLDDDTLAEIEELLLLGDVGVDISMELLDGLKKAAKDAGRSDSEFVMEYFHSEISRMALACGNSGFEVNAKPWVVLVVGVNGVGKTTTIGKMAHQFQSEGKKVLLAAGDTFRAAAGEQLALWAQRANVGIIRHQDGSDPASVVFDAAAAAKARGVDVLLVDTAGRLHTKTNLMEELKKIHRVLKKHDEKYPHEILLVLDATTGQNALQQAKRFCELVSCTGVVVTKLDGTAKGGMILSIQKELGLPIRMIGVGEGMDDLRPFNPQDYSAALFDKSA